MTTFIYSESPPPSGGEPGSTETRFSGTYPLYTFDSTGTPFIHEATCRSWPDTAIGDHPRSGPTSQVPGFIIGQLEKFNIPEADRESFIDRLESWLKGSEGEDEFCLLLHWLGKCILVQQIDQPRIRSTARNVYRLPDLMATFDVDGKSITALIEVKTTWQRQLSWRPDYYESLQRYAALLNLPILVACKWRQVGLWTLFDMSRFQVKNVNYIVTLEAALHENLMGLLAGDFAVILSDGSALHLVQKTRHGVGIGVPATDEEARLTNTSRLYYTACSGAKVCQEHETLWPYFFSARHCTRDDTPYEYVLTARGLYALWAQSVLPAIVRVDYASGNDYPFTVRRRRRWRHLLRRAETLISASNLKESASRAIRSGLVASVGSPPPQTQPSFLESYLDGLTMTELA